VAAESGVIDSSVKTLGYNGTVDIAVLVKNSERLENHSEQHEQTIDLNKNEKVQSQEQLGQSHQVHLYGTALHIALLLNLFI
jgi:hypothetical protein